VPLVIANAVLVRLIWQRGGTDWAINVLGATGLGPTSVNQALANTIGAAIKGYFTSSNYVAACGTGVSLSKIGVRSIGAASQPEFLDSGLAVPGTAAGNLLPPQIAICVTLSTALAGKEYRGRVYLGGPTVAANDANGQMMGSTQTAAVAFIEAIRAGQFGAALTMAILSRKLSVPTPVTLVRSRNLIWETQRRRAIPGI
jgi:hypothetical protein